MAAVADKGAVVASAGAPQGKQDKGKWTRFLLPTYSALVMLYLILPIFIIILYSFNYTSGLKVSFKWQGFSLHAYKELLSIPDLTSAVGNTLVVATISTIIATVIGTLVALALVRYTFRGKQASDLVLFANIAAPEIVLGAALLSFFVSVRVTLGLQTIIISHVMFCIAYVAITVRARLSGFDNSIEEAAQDLGATPWVTFRLVTLPIIFPGILAGALLAFALSIDDFVITNFNSGSVTTFPLWVFGASRVGIPPQVFAIATIIFTVGVMLAATNIVLQARKGARERRAGILIRDANESETWSDAQTS
jgi:spermidine/putrescine transport system permease protein